MHKLTNSRIQWGRGALLVGMALGAIGIFGRPASRPGPGPVSLMSIARRMPPENLPDYRKVRWWPGALLSPDGRWELNWTFGGDSECTVVAHDHSRSLTRRLRDKTLWVSASDKIWLPDSRSWVGLLAGEKSLYAVVQSLDAAGPVRKIPLGFPRGTIDLHDLMSSDLLGFVGPDRVLARPTGPDEWDWRDRIRQVPFYQFSLRAARGVHREYAVALPRGDDYGEVALSPHGDRLAWILYVGARFGQGLLASKSIQLAVSTTGGTGIRVIGMLPTEPGDQYYRHRRLSWLPDGRHVSLYHGGSRWSIPVGP